MKILLGQTFYEQVKKLGWDMENFTKLKPIPPIKKENKNETKQQRRPSPGPKRNA